MAEIIEIGTVSSRGQIAIPSDIRKEMDLQEGARILFFLEGDTLLVRRVTQKTFVEITTPLKQAAKTAGLKEGDVEGIIQRFRKR